MGDALNEVAQWLRTRRARSRRTYRGRQKRCGFRYPRAARGVHESNRRTSWPRPKLLRLWHSCQRRRVRRRSQQHCRGNQVMTTFRRERKRAGVIGNSRCLHNYSADELDCSYADRSQCGASGKRSLSSVSQTLFRKCIRGAARDSNALQARR
jgi:hypothetical protein